MRVHGNDLPYLLSIDEQVLLTLVRLRLGLQFEDSIRLKIPVSMGKDSEFPISLLVEFLIHG